jgi:myo-inositol-1(or 4)-monophosphatase
VVNIFVEDALVYARRAARVAGEEVLFNQPRARQVGSPKDFLTAQDLESERTIAETLKGFDPTIPLFSEERGGTREERMWVVDPIDGTVNYFHQGVDDWGISVALVRDGRTQCGVIYFPGSKEVCLSRQGGEAERCVVGTAFFPLSVSHQKRLAQAQVWTDWAKGQRERTLSIFEQLSRHTLYPQIRLCFTAAMMNVARGRIDGYVHAGPEPFDQAAAGWIVRNAGGTVTDMEGKSWHPFSKSIVATNGLIHDELLKVLQEGR